MTKAELLNLASDKLLAVLEDKELFSLIKTEDDLIDHVLSALPEEAIANLFVKHKFAPKHIISKYPHQFALKFSEYSFNPGAEGIVDLCSLSYSHQMDDLIVSLIKQFSTNKYDASFARSVINVLNANSSLELNKTLAQILSTLSTGQIFLAQILKQHPLVYFKIIGNLDGEARKTAAQLITPSDLHVISSKDHDSLLTVFKLAMDSESYLTFFRTYGVKETFLRLFYNPSTEPLITDEEANKFFDAVQVSDYSRHGYQGYHYQDRIPYRKSYEELPPFKSLACSFKEVPRDSKFFYMSFYAGNSKLPASEAFALISELWSEHQLEKILGSGTDGEMSTLITNSGETFFSHIKRANIKPATLRDSIPQDRPLVASAIYKIVTAPFKKQIASRFKIETTQTKKSVAEIHDEFATLISNNKPIEFLARISSYDDAGSIESGITAFLDRHMQTTYRKKYEFFSLSFEFLAGLKNETIAMTFLNSSLSISRWNDSKYAFLSSSNSFALVNRGKFSPDTGFDCTYEKKEFLNLLTPKELSSLSFAKGDDSNLDLVATLLVEAVRKQASPTTYKYLNSTLRTKVASMTTKAEYKSHFMDSILGYDNHKLVFLNGEKFTGAEILVEAKESYRIHEVIEALEYLEATEELLKVLRAAAAPKPDEFLEIFPRCSKRTHDIKVMAARALSLLNPQEIDISETIRSQKTLSGIAKVLGDVTISSLINHKPKRRQSIVIDTTNIKISYDELSSLAAKYKLSIETFDITSVDQLSFIKKCLELEVKVEGIRAASLLNEELHQKIVELSSQYPALDVFYGFMLMQVAALPGCAPILRTRENLALQQIKNYETLKCANELGLVMSDSEFIAKSIARDRRMLAYAIENNLRFNNIKIVVQSYYSLSNYVDADLAKSIGILILSQEMAERLQIESEIFDDQGGVKEFSPISLAALSLKSRLELIQKIAAKSPKYKKLLSQDVSGQDFVLNPPSMLDKSIFALSTMKEALGFGIPGDLSKDEKESLEETLVIRGPSIGVAVTNYKSLLAVTGQSVIKFDDVFERINGKVSINLFANFLSKEFVRINLSEYPLLFSTILKSISRSELISLFKEPGQEKYTMTFFRDALASFSDAKRALNSFAAILDEPDINSSTIFSAMSGDAAANGFLEERMKAEDDNAEMLRDLSSVVKVVTVNISIARKQAKAGEAAALGVAVHDGLGTLLYETQKILSKKGDAKRAKSKSGFERFNDMLKEDEFKISAKNDKAFYLFFPESLKEVRELGASMKWCTNYNDSYFDNTLGGSAVLFNLKATGSDEVKAQGYIIKNANGAWILNQLRYAANVDAERDFDIPSIIEVIRTVINKDPKLIERYVTAA